MVEAEAQSEVTGLLIKCVLYMVLYLMIMWYRELFMVGAVL